MIQTIESGKGNTLYTVKKSAYNVGDLGSIPGVEKIPCRRDGLPTPVFLPGKFHGQRTLAGYSPWGRKESDLAK